MIELKRTNFSDSDFVHLVRELDAYLSEVDGDDHHFYHQFNGIDSLDCVIVAYANHLPVGCGALKKYDTRSMEIKRMYTKLNARGKGIAQSVLLELESWCAELGFETCVLETGIHQVEAMELYGKMGYVRIENYGQYQGVENSFCFEKIVSVNH